MKAVLTAGNFIAVLVLAFAFKVSATDAPSASLQINNGTNTASVKVSDAFNHVWVVESSSNLVDWAEVGTLKLHNGNFARSFAKDPASSILYFRAFADSSRQDILSMVTNALLLPATPFNYASPDLPFRFVGDVVGQDTMPSTNLTTDAGATLGRALFYDKRLSSNQMVSCASCHKQANGFADPSPFSAGFNGALTLRNSMGLSNARWSLRKKFFWDERAATLEDLALQPIQNSIEMGLPLDMLTNRLAAEPFYTNLFAEAFGSPDITTNRISQALAQFIRSIVSVRSKFDVGSASNFVNFTVQENQGRSLFQALSCSRCHVTDNFSSGPKPENNGLEFPFVDLGIGAITGSSFDDGKFKPPSLRNIELTAPYMHDGRFTNLEQVVEFYNSGVVSNANLSASLREGNNGPPRRPNLSPQSKAALVAFLKTLTDTNLATDVKLSDPFNYGD